MNKQSSKTTQAKAAITKAKKPAMDAHATSVKRNQVIMLIFSALLILSMLLSLIRF